MLNYAKMETILPNLAALEAKVKEATAEINRLQSSDMNSDHSKNEKALLKKSIQKIIKLIEDAE